MNEENQKASDFRVQPGEANFPPPTQEEVVGGAHIAPECITRKDGKFVMVEWPHGLPRHDTERTVRFPHDLMKFGETIEECAERLVGSQLGMAIEKVEVFHIDSYVDDADHWHIEPWLLVEVSGEPDPPENAGEVIYFESTEDLPKDSVWTKEEFADLLSDHLSK